MDEKEAGRRTKSSWLMDEKSVRQMGEKAASRRRKKAAQK
jgi:hypothetical protein